MTIAGRRRLKINEAGIGGIGLGRDGIHAWLAPAGWSPPVLLQNNAPPRRKSTLKMHYNAWSLLAEIRATIVCCHQRRETLARANPTRHGEPRRPEPRRPTRYG